MVITGYGSESGFDSGDHGAYRIRGRHYARKLPTLATRRGSDE